MFAILAVLVIVLSAGAIPIITRRLFVSPNWDDERQSLAIAVKVEKNLNSWRARHQTRSTWN